MNEKKSRIRIKIELFFIFLSILNIFFLIE